MRTRHWMTAGLAALLLSACGDGGVDLAEGGITGSGISVGPITGFGSIWVGGVHFDVSNAEFIRNGQSTGETQSAFQIGEMVSITGEVNPDGISGVATRVEFDRDLAGMVTAVSTDGTTIEIMGQTVRADELTILSGFNSLSSLQLGNVMEVSGIRGADGILMASTITLDQGSFVASLSTLEVEGRVSELNPDDLTFKIGKLVVDYAQAVLPDISKGITAGEYLEIKSNLNLQNGVLKASALRQDQEYPSFTTDSFVRLEGRITQFSNTGVFSVTGQPVSLTPDTVIDNGSLDDLGLGILLGVEGVIDEHGVLEADRLSIRQSADPTSLVELQGTIEGIDAENQTLQLQGEPVRIDSNTLMLDWQSGGKQTLTFAGLSTGDAINMAGRRLASGEILALRLDRGLPKADDTDSTNTDTNTDDAGTSTGGTSKIHGLASQVDTASHRLVIAGVTVITDTHTVYRNTGRSLERDAYFSLLQSGQSMVMATGKRTANQQLLARELKLLTE
ncbi:MAG: hypothetical protein KDI44_04065 [Thiothrix sp.]|nr:hypothetical protein [Thiothrix sp.]